jgi:hypothetical protein
MQTKIVSFSCLEITKNAVDILDAIGSYDAMTNKHLRQLSDVNLEVSESSRKHF